MAKQPVKYWDTQVSAAKSVGQVQDLIVKYGGHQTSIQWKDGLPLAIGFVIHDAKLGRDIPVFLEARVGALKALILKRQPYQHSMRRTRDQYEREVNERALKIIWRHLKDLIEQQLIAVELGSQELTDVFMPHLMLRSGETVGQALRAGTLSAPLAITAGSEV